MTTTTDWSALLLRDSGDDARFRQSLLVWADWLEDNDDRAAEGVRELLVGQGKRPSHYQTMSEYTWWNISEPTEAELSNGRFKVASWLGEYFDALSRFDNRGLSEANYKFTDAATQATALYTALYDASRAFVASRAKEKVT